MMPAEPTDSATDPDLWRRAAGGDSGAFAVLVERYQSLVCAVAYGTCGDLALSEDVAQETFWAAWRGRASLADPTRIRAWLCGIARNLGRNAGRRAARPAWAAEAIDASREPIAANPSPADAAVSREEEDLVRDALGRLPESYRVPLILYYREDRSVAEVAAALDLSEEAVRQRLARGRGMLRDRVDAIVESGLRRSRPTRTFTAAVMAGLASGSVSRNALAAAAGPPALKVAGLFGGGLAGSVLGPLVGLAGGWLGSWLPAQLAPTRPDRDRIRGLGDHMMAASLVFMLAVAASAVAMRWRLLGAWSPLILLGTILLFQGYVAFVVLRALRAQRRFHATNTAPLEPNDAPLRVAMEAGMRRRQGRVYRSRASILGRPLVDINVADPRFPGDPPPEPGRGIARGWIAIGDHARGLILAIGSQTAVGLMAIGGRTLGVISVGGVACGGIAVGGLAVGLVGIGGLGVGILAIGGGAIGAWAAGGGALAWNVAVGGAAIARQAAFGGLAIARDLAAGGEGFAAHFNDPISRAFFDAHPLKQGMDGLGRHRVWSIVALVAVSVVPSALMVPLMYRTRPPEPAADQN
ncbi:RNA polymerase sigma factor [Tundrisphaera sp. TA3]|uniref:RNA polymerase sigma factor n=1 Tax=Tundrisphaera sp. TA3 TaxID=3435775 RepID=UPI003EC039F7